MVQNNDRPYSEDSTQPLHPPLQVYIRTHMHSCQDLSPHFPVLATDFRLGRHGRIPKELHQSHI